MEKAIKGYRVLSLMMDQDDRKMFALGTKSAKNKLHLLELSIPHPNADLSVENITEIRELSYEDKFLARIVVDNTQEYVLIVALASGKRRSNVIVKISLP